MYGIEVLLWTDAFHPIDYSDVGVKQRKEEERMESACLKGWWVCKGREIF